MVAQAFNPSKLEETGGGSLGQPRLHKETLAGGRGAVFQVPLWNAAF